MIWRNWWEYAVSTFESLYLVLIIEAFYADVIKGKLDQLNNHLEIDFAIGRDVTDHQVDEILNVLDNFLN